MGSGFGVNNDKCANLNIPETKNKPLPKKESLNEKIKDDITEISCTDENLLENNSKTEKKFIPYVPFIDGLASEQNIEQTGLDENVSTDIKVPQIDPKAEIEKNYPGAKIVGQKEGILENDVYFKTKEGQPMVMAYLKDEKADPSSIVFKEVPAKELKQFEKKAYVKHKNHPKPAESLDKGDEKAVISGGANYGGSMIGGASLLNRNFNIKSSPDIALRNIVGGSTVGATVALINSPEFKKYDAAVRKQIREEQEVKKIVEDMWGIEFKKD